MKIGAFWSGHDCSFCVLEDGVPKIHVEYERLLREKEPAGDSVSIYEQHYSLDDLDYVALCHPISKMQQHPSWLKLQDKFKDKIHVFSHHQAHAAHGFYTSPYGDATIITIDGGGIESSTGIETATTVWSGEGNKINRITTVPINQMNIGGVWTRVTRYVFGLQSGWPRGHQAGTVMAMAALGNPALYRSDFFTMLTKDVSLAAMKPHNQPRGANVGTDPKHPHLNKWAELAQTSEQTKYDIAAGLQAATEDVFFVFIKDLYDRHPGLSKNVVISGGVALNSVMIGKLSSSDIVNSCYVPPVPYDGGLVLGAAQLLHHEILGADRTFEKLSPHLGFEYGTSDIVSVLERTKNVSVVSCTDDDIINLLNEQNIVAVYGGRSESGRRALGNRSIFADPRSPTMKQTVNDKVKHRQWFRPFAPSILAEHVNEWFETAPTSLYMTHVAKFRHNKKELVPAVVHFDDTGRLQTVDRDVYPWFHNFLTKWYFKTGVPVILNTSFNDSEPICETPEHAVNCFLKTNIDYLYFRDVGLLVSKG